ncbi:MAG: endonuclease/exonuclease/phosphatase family protein [Alistipes sp.]|nr:endonuclease/exonuclease/phosphatase family protein [Alistipes sp.]MBQ5836016.1 endonuclease/exonuclease/phosphatase family protein [Alistipes sp.]
MKKLLIILAFVALGALPASAQKLRLMSYNIHNGWGVDGINSIARIGDVVTKFAPDVVAVQEVDSMTRRNKRYLMGVLGEQTGYHAYYMRTIPHTGGGYGIGMLSKEKALSVQRIPLPCRSEPRGFLLVEFEKYYFACTHLSLHKENQIESVAIIRDILAKLDKPVFIAGDLNARPQSPTMLAFKEFMTVLNDENRNTFNANEPQVCIDYVLCYGATPTVLKSYVDYDNRASDHLPLYVDIQMGKQKKRKNK